MLQAERIGLRRDDALDVGWMRQQQLSERADSSTELQYAAATEYAETRSQPGDRRLAGNVLGARLSRKAVVEFPSDLAVGGLDRHRSEIRLCERAHRIGGKTYARGSACQLSMILPSTCVAKRPR